MQTMQILQMSSNYQLHPEIVLGFEYEMLLPKGTPATNTRMVLVENSRPKIEFLEDKISQYWIKNSKPDQFDGDRIRFEGALYDGRNLYINVSKEKYSPHFYLRNTRLPKSFQAQLYSINGIVKTKDNKLVTGIRNPQNTDQGRIEHIIPAGFIDSIEQPFDATIKTLQKELYLPPQNDMKGVIRISESPFSSSRRELLEELEHVQNEDKLKDYVKPEEIRILGIIYNSLKNFDTTTAVLIPTNVLSSEIKLKGKEHDEICFTDISQKSLEEKFFDLSNNPDTNSGHLRGDLATLYAHKYGKTKQEKLIEKTILGLME